MRKLKRISTLLSLLLMLIVLTIPASAIVDTNVDYLGKVTNVSTAVNVRSGPSTNSASLTLLKNDHPLSVYDSRNGWLYVGYAERKKGWIYKDYVELFPLPLNKPCYIINSALNKSVTIDFNSPDRSLVCWENNRDIWEEVKCVSIDDGWFAIQSCASGQYVTTRIDKDNGPLECNVDNILSWELMRPFKKYENSADMAIITKINGKPLVADQNRSNYILTTYDDYGEWQRFRIAAKP